MLPILYEDKQILSVEKPSGMLSEGDIHTPDSVPYAIAGERPKEKIFVTHRLDRGVGGVLICAKNGAMAAALSEAFATHVITKEYLTVVEGTPKESRATLTHLLFKDAKKNKTYVVDRMRRGVREAVLHYEVIATATSSMEKEGEARTYSLLRVTLGTGRSHQIRAQLSHIGHSIAGDGKYGSRTKIPEIALWSHHMQLAYPTCKGKKEKNAPTQIDVRSFPGNSHIWSLFSSYLQ